jgi:hypothetical protein
MEAAGLNSEFKAELRELIARYLELYNASESTKDGSDAESPNRSVQLGDLEVPGVRSLRDGVLDQIDFAGKRVLDLGSHLGELSRGARARGASLVDGFEHEPFFVELARAIDTYGQVTRVSFHERDIADPSIYRDHYEVVLAFGVFAGIEPVLEEVAGITDELLLLETNPLDDDLEDRYISVVGRDFPHYAILAEHDRRAVIAFARDEPTLLEVLREPRAGTAPPNVIRAAVAHRPGRQAEPRLLQVDLARPPREALQQRFFMMFRFDSLDELLAAVDRMEIDVDTLAKSREIKNLGAEGWIYWFLFTKGYIQYLKTGEIGEGNVYFDYLFGHYVEQGHDPGALWELAEHDLAVERIARRYRDFDMLRREGAKGPDPAPGTKPVRVTVSDWPREPPLHVYEVGAEGPLPVRHIDGWHRLCSARLAGFSSYPCEAVPENLHDKPIRGAVEEFSFDGERLRLQGWYLDPEFMANYELRTGRLILATGAPVDRRDVAAAFPHIGHAGASGFDIDIECELPADAPIRFDLVLMHEIFPVGVIPVLYVPGEEPTQAQTLVYSLLRPLVRRRSLDALDAILECRGGGPPLGSALERLVPTAEVTTIDAKDVGGAPPDSADLVIAHAVLPPMGADEGRAFLHAVRSVVRSGGYVAVTAPGELARRLAAPEGAIWTREDALETYSGLFRVVDYVNGGAGNLHDLAILQKM